MKKYLTSKLKTEWAKKECKAFTKTMSIYMIVMLSMTYFWIDWHDYLDDLAVEEYDGKFVEDQTANLILLIGLLVLQWLPLYIMFRITMFVGDYISYKAGWYVDAHNYFKPKRD
jgi:C4-dicarboxylate transporter